MLNMDETTQHWPELAAIQSSSNGSWEAVTNNINMSAQKWAAARANSVKGIGNVTVSTKASTTTAAAAAGAAAAATNAATAAAAAAAKKKHPAKVPPSSYTTNDSVWYPETLRRWKASAMAAISKRGVWRPTSLWAEASSELPAGVKLGYYVNKILNGLKAEKELDFNEQLVFVLRPPAAKRGTTAGTAIEGKEAASKQSTGRPTSESSKRGIDCANLFDCLDDDAEEDAGSRSVAQEPWVEAALERWANIIIKSIQKLGSWHINNLAGGSRGPGVVPAGVALQDYTSAVLRGLQADSRFSFDGKRFSLAKASAKSDHSSSTARSTTAATNTTATTSRSISDKGMEKKCIGKENHGSEGIASDTDRPTHCYAVGCGKPGAALTCSACHYVR
jgi:hypothetical protein